MSSWLVGFVLAVTFQLAHCVDIAEFDDELAPRRGRDFFAHQLRTTVDIASPVPVLGHAFRWLVGGLDHQIEHHLAPRLPHTVYPIVAARFHPRLRRGRRDLPSSIPGCGQPSVRTAVGCGRWGDLTSSWRSR